MLGCPTGQWDFPQCQYGTVQLPQGTPWATWEWLSYPHGLVWGTLLNHHKNMDLPLDQCETSLTCPRYMELYMDHLETVMVFPCIKVGYPVWPWIIWEKNGLYYWTNIKHPNLSKVYGYSSKRQYLNCYFQCCLWLPLNKLRVESQYLANMSPSNPQLLIVRYNNI